MTSRKAEGRSHLLDLTITDEDFDRAQDARSHSGRCMISQSIVAKYGKESRPIVDADFIRLTHPDTGHRIFYRTPPAAAAALISFDAGIKPPLPLRIRGNVSFERTGRHQNEVPVAEVRAWARERGIPVADKGYVSREVADEYRAQHPGKKVHSDHPRAVTTPRTQAPKVHVGPHSQPRIGNLASGDQSVPPSRRRTWGSRKLTQTLIDQGWLVPGEEPDAAR